MSVINQSSVGSDSNTSSGASSVVSGGVKVAGSVSFFDLLASVPKIPGEAQSDGSAEKENFAKVSSSEDVALDDSLQNAQLFLEVVTKRKVNDPLDSHKLNNNLLGADLDGDILVSGVSAEGLSVLDGLKGDVKRAAAFLVSGIKKVLEASPANSLGAELGATLELNAVPAKIDGFVVSGNTTNDKEVFEGPKTSANLISTLEKMVIRELPNEKPGSSSSRTVALRSPSEISLATENLSQQVLLLKVYVNEAGSNDVGFLSAALGEGHDLSVVSSRLTIKSALEAMSNVDNNTVDSNTHVPDDIELSVAETANIMASNASHKLPQSAPLETVSKGKRNSEHLSLPGNVSVRQEAADSDISVEYTPETRVSDAPATAVSLDIRFEAATPKLVFVALDLSGDEGSPTSEVILNFLEHSGVKATANGASGAVQELYEADKKDSEGIRPLSIDEADVDTQHIKFPKMMQERISGSWLSSEIQGGDVIKSNQIPEELPGSARSVVFEKILGVLQSAESTNPRTDLDDLPTTIRNMSNLATAIDQIVKKVTGALRPSKTSIAVKATSAQYIASQFAFSKGLGSVQDYFNTSAGPNITQNTNTPIAAFEITDAASLLKQSGGVNDEAEKARNVTLGMAENMGTAKSLSSTASPRFASVLPQQSLSFNDPNFASRLTALALDQALKASEPIEINLDPKSFGKIRVSARLDGANFEVQLLVENQTTLNVMRSSEGLLSHLSEQNGLRLSQYSVDFGAGGHSGSNQNEGNRGAGDNSSTTSPEVEKEGLIALNRDESDTDGLNLIA